MKLLRLKITDPKGFRSLPCGFEHHFHKTYLVPALEQGVIEMTLPGKPNSRSQRYRLTTLGQHWLENQEGNLNPILSTEKI